MCAGTTAKLYIFGDKGRAQLIRGDGINKMAACVQDSMKSKDGLSFAAVRIPTSIPHFTA